MTTFLRVGLSGLLLAGCGDLPCTFDAVLPDLAGPGAIDCGSVPLGDDASLVDACVVDAFRSSRAFFASYQLQGTDSQVSSALVCDGVHIWTLLSDSDVSGGSGLGASIDQSDCVSPSVEVGEAGHEVLACDFSSTPCSTRLCGPVPLGRAPCGD